MHTGQVTATSLNVRDAPAGAKLGELPRGSRIDVFGERDGWLTIGWTEGQAYVKASFVADLGVPPAARASDIKVVEDRVLGPGDIQLGKLFRLGMFTNGATEIGAAIAARPADYSAMPASLVRIARAVSVNEGKLEAVNTWDNSFLSYGVFQWTAGAGAAEGELGAMLAYLKSSDPGAYQFYLGRYGLQPVASPAAPNAVPVGRLLLDGRTLASAADKEALRTHLWAWRFWRAGHDPAVRRAQIEFALNRVEVFRHRKTAELKGRALGEWVTSEAGFAQLLDHHVNRPGHVAGCVGRALEAVLAGGASTNPARWSTATEGKLLSAYLTIRQTYGGTLKMTDSQRRADRINAAADAGKISRARGSCAFS